MLEFWYFGVRNRLERRYERGGFRVDFRRYDMRIRTLSGNFALRLRANEYSYGYLLSSLMQGREDNLRGYAMLLYIVASCVCEDDGLRRDLMKGIERYEGRLERKAAKAAKEAGGEAESEACVEQERSDLEAAGLSRRARRRRSRERVKKAEEALRDEQE